MPNGIEGMKQSVSEHEKVEEAFFREVQDKLGDNLALYCVTGSLARKDIIAGWSDVDVLVIIKQYTPEVFTAIGAALAANKTDIKIGTTIYSAEEFAKTEIFFDPKSQYSLELIRAGIYNPRFTDPKLDPFEPKADVIGWFDSVNLTRLLFDLKRGVISGNPEEERAMYKNMITIFKILLYKKGDLSVGYDETVTKARDILLYTEKIPTVEEIMTDKNAFKERLRNYIDFIVWLERNEINK
jgi:predicted nucleotidyltransferase